MISRDPFFVYLECTRNETISVEIDLDSIMILPLTDCMSTYLDINRYVCIGEC